MNYDVPWHLRGKEALFRPAANDVVALKQALDRFNAKHLDIVHNAARDDMRAAQKKRHDHKRSRQESPPVG